MKCQVCGTKAHYGLEYKKPTHCKNDKSDEMVYVTASRCLEPGCIKQSRFGLELKKATHCSKHKFGEMYNVMAKQCVQIGCTTRPTFGLLKATHCVKHKPDDMFDTSNKPRCAYENCDTFASFGIIKGKATHCVKHKPDQMYNVMSNQCLFIDCLVRPTFGLKKGKALYCIEHKPELMKDVISKQCEYNGCTTQPVFGLKYNMPTHCKNHALDTMYNVLSKKCNHLDCTTRPNFGLEFKKPTHCKTHKTTHMIDVVSKLCNECDSTMVNRSYKPNCARCHFYLHPDDPRIRNYKVKEHAFMQPLKEIYPDIILDKIISGGCSKRRPDGFIDCLTHSIIIEIDEAQHIGYESLCDNRRTMELFQDLGERPVIFIRLNPDSYRLDNKTIKGCFSRSKSNELKLIKKEFSIRFNALLEAVEAAKQIPGKEIHPIKLFYSE